MTKIFNFALKIKGGSEGGTCEVLRPCHPPKFGSCTLTLFGPGIIMDPPLSFFVITLKAFEQTL